MINSMMYKILRELYKIYLNKLRVQAISYNSNKLYNNYGSFAKTTSIKNGMNSTNI